MNAKYTDQEILQLISEDDASAFEVIYTRYAKSMFTYAFNILKDKAIAEDIIQNVFIDLWTRRKEVKILKLKPYLSQSVRFQVFKQLRKNISTEHLERLNLLDLSRDASQHLEFQELETLVKAKVNKLAPSCQKIFIMSRFDNKSNKEIASELHISMQAVKNQISKALKFLRQELLIPH